MQSRRIAPPLDLRAELAADKNDPVKQAPARAPAKTKTVNKRLVLKRLYRKEPKLKLNTFVAKAIIAEPKLKLREAEEYFKLRRQQDKLAKAKDPKKRKIRKDKETATSRIGGLSEEQPPARAPSSCRPRRCTDPPPSRLTSCGGKLWPLSSTACKIVSTRE